MSEVEYVHPAEYERRLAAEKAAKEAASIEENHQMWKGFKTPGWRNLHHKQASKKRGKESGIVDEYLDMKRGK